MLTVDVPVIGNRIPDHKNRFEFPKHLPNFEPGTKFYEYDSALSWKTVEWLKTVTKLPIILKGILRADDAKLAADAGMAAIIVSNHGGRQLDGTPATIDALPEIVNELSNTDCEVFLDGGIRKGTDVLKALGLGAKIVFVGRPALWGLTLDGQDGVTKVLDILKTEFSRSMALSGCQDAARIDKTIIVN